MHLVELLCTDLYAFSKTRREIESKIPTGVLIVQLNGAQTHYFNALSVEDRRPHHIPALFRGAAVISEAIIFDCQPCRLIIQIRKAVFLAKTFAGFAFELDLMVENGAAKSVTPQGMRQCQNHIGHRFHNGHGTVFYVFYCPQGFEMSAVALGFREKSLKFLLCRDCSGRIAQRMRAKLQAKQYKPVDVQFARKLEKHQLRRRNHFTVP